MRGNIYFYKYLYNAMRNGVAAIIGFPTTDVSSCNAIFNLVGAAAITANLFLLVGFPTHHSILQLGVEDRMRVAKASCDCCTDKVKNEYAANCLKKEPRTSDVSCKLMKVACSKYCHNITYHTDDKMSNCQRFAGII